jgi:hypothetical protein
LLGWIERQQRLQPHQHVNDEQAAQVEQQHAHRIGHRVLLLAFVHAGNLIDCDLDRPQGRRQEGALAAENARHIGAKHGGNGDDDRAIEQYLDPADDGHSFIPSEQFRLEQRVDQIDEQSRGYERSERVVKNHDCISS